MQRITLRDIISYIVDGCLPNYKYSREMSFHAASLYRHNEVSGARGVQLILNMTKYYENDYDTAHLRAMMNCFLVQHECGVCYQAPMILTETYRRLAQNKKALEAKAA